MQSCFMLTAIGDPQGFTVATSRKGDLLTEADNLRYGSGMTTVSSSESYRRRKHSKCCQRMKP